MNSIEQSTVEIAGKNQFGKTSRIYVRALRQEDRTILKDVSFTAPFKIMTPFPKKNGGIQIIPLSASAGIMRGDRQEFTYIVEEGADLEVLSQSFEKIHKMEGGCATRQIIGEVAKHAVLYCCPQPVIPFAGSAYESDTRIYLEDGSAALFFLEIICCGRIAYEEEFAYRRFVSKIEISREGKLIYRDNTVNEPDTMPMRGIGLYEGYTHLANLFISRQAAGCEERIQEFLDEKNLDGGVSRLACGDLAVRIFGRRAQTLQEAADAIKEIVAPMLEGF